MVRFEVGDEIDQALCGTLSHEFFLCDTAFSLFSKLAHRQILGNDDKSTRIFLYDAYTRFLIHLYEFCKGADKRDRKNTDKRKMPKSEKGNTSNSEPIDHYFDNQVNRILANHKALAKARKYEGNVFSSELECVTPDFGKNFRFIRNIHGHVDYKRSLQTSQHISLQTFYHHYHACVCLLYFDAKGWWRQDLETVSWPDIEAFSVLVKGV